jgi:hypothetical protein
MLSRLDRQLPVPRLLTVADSALHMEYVSGVHGQELIEAGHAARVLRSPHVMSFHTGFDRAFAQCTEQAANRLGRNFPDVRWRSYDLMSTVNAEVRAETTSGADAEAYRTIATPVLDCLDRAGYPHHGSERNLRAYGVGMPTGTWTGPEPATPKGVRGTVEVLPAIPGRTYTPTPDEAALAVAANRCARQTQFAEKYLNQSLSHTRKILTRHEVELADLAAALDNLAHHSRQSELHTQMGVSARRVSPVPGQRPEHIPGEPGQVIIKTPHLEAVHLATLLSPRQSAPGKWAWPVCCAYSYGQGGVRYAQPVSGLDGSPGLHGRFGNDFDAVPVRQMPFRHEAAVTERQPAERGAEVPGRSARRERLVRREWPHVVARPCPVLVPCHLLSRHAKQRVKALVHVELQQAELTVEVLLMSSERMLQKIRADHGRVPPVHLRIGLLFSQDSVVVVHAHAQRTSNCTAVALTRAGATCHGLEHKPSATALSTAFRQEASC